MDQKVAQLIEELSLIAHPEGGYYSETYRSEMDIPGKNRQLMTAIYFLLPSEQVSKFHRIKSDELWFFHSGSPLLVHTLTNDGHTVYKVGNNLKEGQSPQLLVPKNTVFGSSVSEPNSYSLVSCVVAPGFDFEDFELFQSSDLLPIYPHCKEIISRLT